MRGSWRNFLACTWAGLGLLAVPVPALACGPILVCATKASFAAGTQLPASTKAIPLAVPKPLQAPFAPLVPELRDAAGKLVATELVDDTSGGYKLLRPLKGLAANSAYTLVLPGFCQDALGALVPPVELPFATGPDLPAPQGMGTLQLTYVAPDQVLVWTSVGSCTVPIQAARGHVAVTPAAEMAPWLPITRAELWVDGAKWAGGLYGDVPTQPGPPQSAVAKSVQEFYVACGPVPDLADPGLAPGQHHVDVRFHVAGEFNDPPYLYGDLSVTCGASTGGDAGGSEVSGSEVSGSEVSGSDVSGLAGDTASGPPTNAAPASSGSCSAGRPAFSWVTVGLLLTFGVLGRCLRRRLATCPSN